MTPKLNDLIADYQRTANLSPCLESCPLCYSHNITFKQHDSRTRELRYCEYFFVKTFLLTLFRFKCSVCKKTFTFYPDFLLPYKRFITPSILSLCQAYLSMGEASYRQIVRPNDSQYAYQDSSNQELSHVSLWNWFKGLSALSTSAHKAAHWLFQLIPDCPVHRDVTPVNPRKYRSEARLACLQQAEWVIRVNHYLQEHTINVRLFPTIVNK